MTPIDNKKTPQQNKGNKKITPQPPVQQRNRRGAGDQPVVEDAIIDIKQDQPPQPNLMRNKSNFNKDKSIEE